MAEIEELKELFGSETLSYEQFSAKVAAKGDALNLANLAGGKYIAVEKHNRELEAARKASGNVPDDYESSKRERDDFKAKYEALSAKETHRDRVAIISDASKVGAAVKPEFADFVISEIAKTEDGKKDFEKAAKDYISKHPQYASTGRRVVKVDSSKHEDGGNGGGNKSDGKGFFGNFIIEHR